jgi:hypothetical protein
MRRKSRRVRPPIACLKCDRLFFAPPSARRQFCSVECYRASSPNADRALAVEPRFWRRVEKTPTCWLWMGGQDSHGYGAIGLGGRRSDRTHRLAWEIASGIAPQPGQVVLHTCDNPLCVRNDEIGMYLVDGKLLPRFGHLVLGTRADNNADKFSKGRNVITPSPGSRNGRARLSERQIVAIRESYASGQANRATLAAAYKVSESNISQIIGGKSWKDVGGPLVNGRLIGWKYHRRAPSTT